MTALERAAVIDLLAAVADLRPWLDDTAYPRQSRMPLDAATAIVAALLADDPAERRRRARPGPKGKAR